MADTQAFIDSVLPEAEAAAKALGIPVAPILAQWINETGSGSSKAWRNGNNPAGISILEPQMKRLGATIPRGWGEVLSFPSVSHGLLAYILRWRDPVYAPTRQRWADHGDDISVAEAIQDSPWAEGHYGGHGLVDLINGDGLTRYDTFVGGGNPPPPPTQPGGPDRPPVPCAALSAGPPPAGHPLLKVGMSGSQVALLQELLLQHGFKPVGSFRANGKPDGIFGPHTAEAVAEFQTANGLHRDGIVGRQTYCALGIN